MNRDIYPKVVNLGFGRLVAGLGIPQSRKVPEQAPEGLVSKQKRRIKRLDMVGKLVPSKLSQFERAYSGKSLRAAINANCLDCIGHEQAEGKRCSILDFHLNRQEVVK